MQRKQDVCTVFLSDLNFPLVSWEGKSTALSDGIRQIKYRRPVLLQHYGKRTQKNPHCPSSMWPGKHVHTQHSSCQRVRSMHVAVQQRVKLIFSSSAAICQAVWKKVSGWNNINVCLELILLRVNKSLSFHYLLILQHMIQPPFLAKKAIVLKHCSLVTFQTNDLTRTPQTNAGLIKDSQLQDSVYSPSKGDPTLFRLSSFRHSIPLPLREVSNSWDWGQDVGKLTAYATVEERNKHPLPCHSEE